TALLLMLQNDDLPTYLNSGVLPDINAKGSVSTTDRTSCTASPTASFRWLDVEASWRVYSITALFTLSQLRTLKSVIVRHFRLFCGVVRRNTDMVEEGRCVPYELIDIGANLTHPSFDGDLLEVLRRSKQAGLSKIMVTGTSVKHSEEARDLVRRHSGYLYFTAGVHPHDAKEFSVNTLDALRTLCNEPDCVAVGECGLDFNRNFSPQDQQRIAFEAQVKLACELKKPLFIHEREAHGDMVTILSRYKDALPPAVIHCFTGTAAEAVKYIEMGLYIGLTGFIWKDRSDDGVKYALQSGKIPLERLVLETDAPFMYSKINDKRITNRIKEAISEGARAMHRFSSFSRNEPCALAAICELIAAYMGEPALRVAAVTTANAKSVYALR
uniref:Deoxyribonuclease TATDN1 n=2 Tax=Parascaris univalens TaxID=6257 RepID=A0A915CAZ7_PARUN